MKSNLELIRDQVEKAKSKRKHRESYSLDGNVDCLIINKSYSFVKRRPRKVPVKQNRPAPTTAEERRNWKLRAEGLLPPLEVKK